MQLRQLLTDQLSLVSCELSAVASRPISQEAPSTLFDVVLVRFAARQLFADHAVQDGAQAGF